MFPQQAVTNMIRDVADIIYRPRFSRLSLSTSSCSAARVSSCCCCRKRTACSRWCMRRTLVPPLSTDAASSLSEPPSSHAVVLSESFWRRAVSGRRWSRSFISGRGGHVLERVLMRVHCGSVLSGGSTGKPRLSTVGGGMDCFSMLCIHSNTTNRHPPWETCKPERHTCQRRYLQCNQLTHVLHSMQNVLFLISQQVNYTFIYCIKMHINRHIKLLNVRTEYQKIFIPKYKK